MTMSPTQIAELADMIETWLGSVAGNAAQEALTEHRGRILILEDRRSAGNNGVWQYFLTADTGLWRTYTPGALASQHGGSYQSEAASSMMLATAASRSYCCPKSFMFDLITVDFGTAESNPLQGPIAA